LKSFSSSLNIIPWTPCFANSKAQIILEKAGAIGTFTGIVRAVTENTRTEFLEFESHGELAQKKMDEICEDLKQKDGIVDVLMHHRTGIIAIW